MRASACWSRAAATGAAGRLLPESWVADDADAVADQSAYGFLWWLNRGGARYQSAPASSVFALGAGGNIIWIDPEHDLVAVLRWIDGTAVDGFLSRLLAAVA